jgi:hypothetical protein
MSDNFFGFIVLVLWEIIDGECNMPSFQPVAAFPSRRRFAM